MLQETLLLIKPNITHDHKIGEIIHIIEEHDFLIKEVRSLYMDDALASQFYAEHLGKSFYNPLVQFMCSDMIVALRLEKKDAVQELRKLIGNTDPSKAVDGTIRHDYGETVRRNAVHASDSLASAEREMKIIFAPNS